ncbi:MAG: hypothetical protein CBB97_10505 [Candidatus Endolissoclinum sp. TMED37]|nr:MAG: hypothetical protein CBB97_10505 [Candidatus Endolissoclinum sp. TMED37]
MNLETKAVKEFWNEESCGERYLSVDSTKGISYKEEMRQRYELEPYLKTFAKFDNLRGLDVLEIGVGLGSDHSTIALAEPSTLTGIDLTKRAIDHTKKRFKEMGLSSKLNIGNAENMSFEDKSFDFVYSWGVLHHSPNTRKCFDEIYRVLRPGGKAKIMIYHKYSCVGLMLWLRYGLFSLKPFMTLTELYANHLESPGTKAYTIKEANNIASKFSKVESSVELSFGDLLIGDVGKRHRGQVLTLAKTIYPRRVIKLISKIFPIGLYILMTVEK